MVAARGWGSGKGVLSIHWGQRISGEDEKVLQIEGGDGCTTI